MGHLEKHDALSPLSPPRQKYLENAKKGLTFLFPGCAKGGGRKKRKRKRGGEKKGRKKRRL